MQLEPNRSADPHVERLIEAFALLTARVQQKLHDEFPELTDALLHVLYPHYLAPIPSLAMLQFDLDPTRGNPKGVPIPAKSMLRAPRVGDVASRFRTCYPVTLWPITINEAKLLPPPFPPGITPPDRASAFIRLRLQAPGEVTFGQMQLDRLRFHLHGDHLLTFPLYDLLMNGVVQVMFRLTDVKGAAPIVLSPEECLHPVGFGLNEGLLPYPKQSFPGYRLLTEYFAFPFKFHFFDLSGWDLLRQAGASRQVEVIFFLVRGHGRLEQALDASMFRLGVTPIVNLFEMTGEPIPLTHVKHEYKIMPEVGEPRGYEVYSIDQVTGATPDGQNTDFRPFYNFRHGGDRKNQETFWYSTRQDSLIEGDHGTDVLLNLVDLGFDPAKPAETVLVVRMTCTNRDLPNNLPRQSDEVRFDMDFSAPGARVRTLRNPTTVKRPPLRHGAHWRLLSHLTLNHLSLGEGQGEEGRDALKEILRMYDFHEPEDAASTVAQNMIDGIVDLKSRRVVAWTGGPTAGGFGRGIEITIEFDEAKYVGVSMYLFAAVLERFFGLYVSMNSFSQLVARVKQREGELKRWPPRAGDQALV
ncbi:MAG: type VI secretion system baseplate subunit TssF [Planctomycetes bacterium]|nr:type VI secretion system baseplate subunit TssF [Planctomycetota bacterium]